MMNANEAKLPKGGMRKPRKLSQRQKESYVQQGIGARMACLGLMERVTDPDARAAIMELGKLADKTIIEYGGMYFASFEQCVEKMQVPL